MEHAKIFNVAVYNMFLFVFISERVKKFCQIEKFPFFASFKAIGASKTRGTLNF